MKYCKQCGNLLIEGKKFCTKCGNAVPDEKMFVPEAGEEKKGLRKKGKYIFLSVMICFVVAVIVFLSMYFGAEEKLKRNLFSENWEEAGVVYQDMLSTGKVEKAEKVINDTLGEIMQKYEERQLPYEKAVICLEKLQDLDDGERVQSTLEYIEALEGSRKAYEMAEKYWLAEDYENAILQYRLVIETDKNYQTATERIETGLGIYKEQVLKTIDELAFNENYGEAIQKIAIAQDILGYDTDLIVLGTKYEKAGLENALEEYEEAEEYEAAILLLQKHSSLMETDSDLKNKFETMKGKYREKLFEQAKIQYDESGYEAAIGVLSQGLQNLSDDSEIQGKIEEYKACAPVALQKLNVLSTDDEDSLENKFETETIEDLYGNQYNGYFYLWCSAHEQAPYVEFITDGKYSHLRGTYFVGKKTRENYSVKFTIYADGVEIYNSGYITRKEKAVNFDLPINHAETVRIEAKSGDGYYESTPRIMLANAEVYNTME